MAYHNLILNYFVTFRFAEHIVINVLISLHFWGLGIAFEDRYKSVNLPNTNP